MPCAESTTYQKIGVKYWLMKRGQISKKWHYLYTEVPKWMQLPLPNHLNHGENACCRLATVIIRRKPKVNFLMITYWWWAKTSIISNSQPPQVITLRHRHPFGWKWLIFFFDRWLENSQKDTIRVWVITSECCIAFSRLIGLVWTQYLL